MDVSLIACSMTGTLTISRHALLVSPLREFNRPEGPYLAKIQQDVTST